MAKCIHQWTINRKTGRGKGAVTASCIKCPETQNWTFRSDKHPGGTPDPERQRRGVSAAKAKRAARPAEVSGRGSTGD